MSRKSATRAEKRRMDRIKIIGCLPCLLDGMPDRICDVHHVLDDSGEKRLGHRFTYGGCLWHHKGDERPYGKSTMREVFGPSLAEEPSRYAERYGSEQQLVELQDFLIEAYEYEPWPDFQIPRVLVSQLREKRHSLVNG